MYVDIPSARDDERQGSARVTPNVPKHVLGYTSPTFPFYPHISAIDETHPIALVCIERFQWALESHMIRTRPIRGLTRFQAR